MRVINALPLACPQSEKISSGSKAKDRYSV
jgi:hypothetical protein